MLFLIQLKHHWGSPCPVPWSPWSDKPQIVDLFQLVQVILHLNLYESLVSNSYGEKCAGFKDGFGHESKNRKASW
jgi:hypothetical protein